MSGPKLLTPPGGELLYDHTNKDGELFLLDRALEGCLCLRFDRAVTAEGGCVVLDGKPVPFVVRDFSGLTVLGVDLRRELNDYGKKALLAVSGFRALDGDEMETLTLPVTTPEREAPRPEYAAHEAIALQAANVGCRAATQNKEGSAAQRQKTKKNGKIAGSAIFPFFF